MTKHIVIVGGGFAGVKAALELCKHEQFKVTVVSKESVFNYYPSLYHTATGGSRVVSSIPLGELFGGKPVELIIGEAVHVDKKQKKIILSDRQEIPYDRLLLALGMMTNFFGIQGLEEFSMTVKSIDRVEKLKRHLQQQLISDQRPDLNYVLIGAGPTGIEYAGALPHYLGELMKKHGLPKRRINIELIEAKPHILPALPKSVSKKILRRLRSLGVKVLTNQTIDEAKANELIVDGKAIQSKTVIWTAGVTNNPFYKNNDFQLNEKGRVVVDQFLRAAPDIFVLGDNADTPFSGLAQTALHDAQTVSRNLIREAEQKAPLSYTPRKPIYVIPVGDKWAAVVWGRIHLYGRLGWFMRVLADWVGYHDLEPWWKATARTFAETIRED